MARSVLDAGAGQRVADPDVEDADTVRAARPDDLRGRRGAVDRRRGGRGGHGRGRREHGAVAGGGVTVVGVSLVTGAAVIVPRGNAARIEAKSGDATRV